MWKMRFNEAKAESQVEEKSEKEKIDQTKDYRHKTKDRDCMMGGRWGFYRYWRIRAQVISAQVEGGIFVWRN